MSFGHLKLPFWKVGGNSEPLRHARTRRDVSAWSWANAMPKRLVNFAFATALSSVRRWAA